MKSVEEQVDSIYESNKMVSPRKQWDDFNKLERYIHMLTEISLKTDHKVHNEIEEAVKKLKELTYA